MAPKLTIGMATYDDFDGVYFTVQALRLYHRELTKDIEFVIVDNHPGHPPGKACEGFLKNWGGNNAGQRYIPLERPVGTSVSRNTIFEVALAPWVMCVDCHILLEPGALARTMKFIDGNDQQDLFTGPLIYDNLSNITTHFNDEWRGEMWGTWGQAWECCEGGIRFSCISTKAPDGEQCTQIALGPGRIPLTSCHKCGKVLPRVKWPNHEAPHHKAGYTRLGMDANGPIFEIPGQGLGLFMARKDAWLGFNPHARGFGGEEMYIHEKYRQHGRATYCLPWLKWMHRFGRPGGVPYTISRYSKVRNYVLEHQELGLPLDEVFNHFVAAGHMTKKTWDYILENPIQNVTNPEQGGCNNCPGDDAVVVADITSVDAAYSKILAMPRDLDHHMPKLLELAKYCTHVTEFSKRRESTVALLAAEPERLVSYQMDNDALLSHLAGVVGDDVNWQMRVEDSVEVDEIEETDMVFIDSTSHTFARLSSELAKFAPRTKRFIAIHDTKLYAEKGEDGGPGLLAALRAHMRANPEWSVFYHTDKQYGLTVISRHPDDQPKLPSVWKMAGNLASALTDHVVRGKGWSSKEELEARLEICSLCTHRTEDRCSVCGCFLVKKASMRAQPCPLGKWPQLDVDGGVV